MKQLLHLVLGVTLLGFSSESLEIENLPKPVKGRGDSYDNNAFLLPNGMKVPYKPHSQLTHSHFTLDVKV